MRVTLKEIAERVGVTPQLVSFYLNHPDTTRVARATRKRIDEAVRESNYRPNDIARALSTGKTGTIALIIGGMTQRCRGCYVHVLMNCAKRRGYHLLIVNTNYNQREEQQELENMLSRQVDGLLYHLYLDPASPVYSRLRKNRFPILMHTPQAGHDFNLIGHTGDALCGALRAFAERGHRKIGIATPELSFRDLTSLIAGVKGIPELMLLPTGSPEQLNRVVRQQKLRGLIFTEVKQESDFLRLADAPDLEVITYYSLPFEHVDDPRIIGGMHYLFLERAELEIDRMIEIIEHPDEPPRTVRQPSCYCDRKALDALYRQQLVDLRYQDFL